MSCFGILPITAIQPSMRSTGGSLSIEAFPIGYFKNSKSMVAKISVWNKKALPIGRAYQFILIV
jgi:hypothetical protein